METHSVTLARHYQKYGDRTSSLLSLYPHFKSFETNELEGQIRYVEKKGVVAIANEPISPHHVRFFLIQSFFKNNNFKNKDKLAFPLSERLASELRKEEGIHVWQIGVEPIFVLADYFADNYDPLLALPIARNLKRRGAVVGEISEEQRTPLADEIEELRKDWLSTKKSQPLEFLNIVDPLAHEEYKRYFILKDKEKVMAFLSASPIFLNEEIIGYFFNDILRRSDARSATSELLIIEAMRVLHQEGVIEVRLGMCPLAMIAPEEKDAKKLTGLYQKWKWGYQFKSLYQFKNKLNPTSWRPLYLASDRPEFARMIKNVLKIHMSAGFVTEFLKRHWYAARKNLELKEKIKIKIKTKTKSLPKAPQEKRNQFLDVLFKIKWTVSFFTFFVGLHLLKNNQPMVAHWYDLSAYIPGNVTIPGILIGPMFHNHQAHLIGDQLSFFILAGALEYTFGSALFFGITAIGLWLSNPVSHLLLSVTLKFSSPIWWERVLLEKDYGSSNAVFALVGASAYVLKKNAWLLWPFIFQALYICLQRESYLAIHHLVGIFLGYVASAWFFLRSKSESKFAL